MDKYKDMDDIKLDAFEQEIEDSLDLANLRTVDNFEEKKRIAMEAAAAFNKKNERISVRLTSNDLRAIKVTAMEEGIPYQTLVSSILHKFVTGRLVDSSKHNS